ncbi:hypothetical protein HPP92_009152 [Vanilla planifolia]|uniref:Uncharacterized protein n=1 Tax=Vanilla planifolia TaxID=51239 RepID=A0A835V6C7_VANPL|nr:hypothetical protein HPP92_009152 [Vanilla planifolia]
MVMSLLHDSGIENTEWVDWHAGVLVKRNAMENIHNWACGLMDHLSVMTRISTLMMNQQKLIGSVNLPSSIALFSQTQTGLPLKMKELLMIAPLVSFASPSPNSDDADEVVVGESEDLADEMASLQFSGSKCDDTQEMNSICLGNGPVNEPNETSGNLSPSECEKPLEWVEWRETVDLIDENGANTASSAPNGDFEIEAFDSKHDNGWASDKTEPRIQL